MPLTGNQKEAVELDGCSILLNAGAGSGKTHVLTERVVRLLTSGDMQTDEVLVLTFTKAAAQEMKNRIAAKMQAELENVRHSLEQDPGHPALEQRVSFLSRQIAMLPSAAIQTIDSFCNDVVRQNHALVGLPGNVLMAQELEQTRMKNWLLDLILAEHIRKHESGVMQMLKAFGGIRQAKHEIRSLSDRLSSFDDKDLWLSGALDSWKPENLEKTACQSVDAVLSSALLKMKDSAILLAQNADQKPKTAAYMQSAAEACSRMSARLESDGPQGLQSSDFSFLQKNSPAVAETEQTVLTKRMFADAKSQLKEFTDISAVVQEQIRRMKVMEPVVRSTVELTLEYDRRYQDLKKERGLIDFSDMEAYALQILSIPMIRDQYRNQYRQVFVDEYQDTNPVQEKIITLAARDNNLFCVGDMKQSIYRFRSADPLLFRRRSKLYQEDSSRGKVINLFRNFRSTTNVLNCCDDVFSVLSTHSRELDYGEADRLQVGRTAQGPVQDTLLITSSKEDADPDTESSELESEAIAGYIQERMKHEIYDPRINEGKGGMRPCRWSDFAVIGRKRTEFLSSLMDVLNRNGIPYSLDKSGPLLKTLEIQMLVQILGLSAGYEDDYALLNAMHNGFFGFTDQDITDLARLPGNTFMEKLSCQQTETSLLGLKCSRFMQFIQELKTRDDSQPLQDVISWAADELAFRIWCTALGEGRQRLANVDLLIQLGSDFQRDGRNRLHAFLSALKLMENDSQTLESARIQPSSDSVLLTTIHGSKGMQYPIVIIPFAGKTVGTGSGMKEPKLTVEHDITHPDSYSVSLPYIDPDQAAEGELFLNELAKSANKEKSIEEERRLLYVAMTRAQEELVITGQKPGKGKSSASLMNWILQALDSHPDHLGKWKEVPADNYARLLGPAASETEKKTEHRLLKADPGLFEPEEDGPVQRDVYPVPVSVGASRAVGLMTGCAKGNCENPFAVIRSEEQLDEDTDHLEAAQRGIQIHSFMEQADFKQILRPGYVENKAEEMFGPEQTVIDADKIRTLFSQPEALYIKEADVVIREKPGSLQLPYSEMDLEYKGDLSTKIQAVIDLVVRKDGKWYLFDYKSDQIGVTPEAPTFRERLEERKQHHRIQMELYRRVLKDNFDIEIEGSWLAFTEPGVFVPVYQKSKQSA